MTGKIVDKIEPKDSKKEVKCVLIDEYKPEDKVGVERKEPSKRTIFLITVDKERYPMFELKEIPFELLSAKHPLVKRSAAIFADKPFAEQFLKACIKGQEQNEKIRKNLIDKLRNSR